MKKPLHPAILVAAAAVCVALLAGVFMKFGGGPPEKSGNASPYTKVGEIPTSAGSGINSLTGEPLSDTAKAHAESSLAQYTKKP